MLQILWRNCCPHLLPSTKGAASQGLALWISPQLLTVRSYVAIHVPVIRPSTSEVP